MKSIIIYESTHHENTKKLLIQEVLKMYSSPFIYTNVKIF